jgi:hypothetical protein
MVILVYTAQRMGTAKIKLHKFHAILKELFVRKAIKVTAVG